MAAAAAARFLLWRPLRQWWTQSNAQALREAQDALLQTLVRAPFRRQPAVAGVHSVEFVSSEAANSSRNKTNNKPQQHTVVLAHGFGSGLGFFYNNIDLLLQPHTGIHRVVAVDWLGMGGSERPSCRAAPIVRFNNSKCGWCDSDFTTPAQAVGFFIDPFHEWMERQVAVDHGGGKTENQVVTLVGHSLGGYLAARYAFKHQPHYLRRLVLASPVGFPRRPPNSFGGAQLPTSLRIVDALWSRNLTPQQLVRWAGGIRGRRSVHRALRARLPHLPAASADVLAEYLYHITVAEPSGEFAMNSLLEPVAAPDVMGVFAREPLEDVLLTNTRPQQQRQQQQQQSPLASSSSSATTNRLSSVKVLYEDQDWMRPNEASARETLRQLQALHPTTLQEALVDIVPRAGHHLYLENPADFVRHIVAC